jgi:hypothetical protein
MSYIVLSSSPQTMYSINCAQTDIINVLFAKFDEYCEPRRNTIMERYKFNIRVQRHNETADQYVTELKLLATNCNFGSLEDELIRDRVV